MGSAARALPERPGRTVIYAVIRSGGKQYRVERDQLLDIDLIEGEVGSTVELKEVLLVANNGDVQVGTPTVDGAVVEAEIIEHGRDKKLRVFKYKAKTRYRRRIGHRTHYTRLAIKRILQDGKETVSAEEDKPRPKAKRPTRRAKKEEPETVAEETAVEAAAGPAAEAETPAAEAEAPAAEAAAEAAAETETKPKRASRRTTTRKAAKADDGEAPEAEASAEPKKPARRRATTSKAAGKPEGTTRRRTRTAKSEEPAPEDKPDEEAGG